MIRLDEPNMPVADCAVDRLAIGNRKSEIACDLTPSQAASLLDVHVYTVMR